MNRKTAEQVVLTTSLLVAAMYAYRKLTEPALSTGNTKTDKDLFASLGYGPPPTVGRFVTAFGFAYVVIGTITQFAPGFGASLAVIFAASDVIANGAAIADDVQVGLGNKSRGETTGTISGTPVPLPGETDAQFQQRLNDYLTGRVKSGTLMTPAGTTPTTSSNPLLKNPLTGQANPLIK